MMFDDDKPKMISYVMTNEIHKVWNTLQNNCTAADSEHFKSIK